MGNRWASATQSGPAAPLGFTVAAQEPDLIRGTRPSELMAVLGSPAFAAAAAPGREGGAGSRVGPSWACVLACVLHLWSKWRSSRREGGPVSCPSGPPPPGQLPQRSLLRAPRAPRRAELGWDEAGVAGCLRVRADGVRLRRRSASRLLTDPSLRIDFHVKRVQSSR